MEIKFTDSAGLIVLGAVLLGLVLFPEFAQAIGKFLGKDVEVKWKTRTRVGVGIFGIALMLIGVLLSFRNSSTNAPVAPTPTDTETAMSTPTNTPTMTPTPTNTPTMTPTRTNTPTMTPTRTNTPQPASAPPGASLAPGDYTIVQPSCVRRLAFHPRERYLLRLRWGATTRELAERGADFVNYAITLDGEPIHGIENYRCPAIFVADPACPGDPSDAWWVYWDYPLGTLPFGDHLIVATLVTSAAIDTGWNIVPADTTHTFSVQLYIVPHGP